MKLFKKIFRESNCLMEMVTLRKNTSRLPVNLYLDDSMSYIRYKHSKLIKFQPDTGDKPVTRAFISMLLDGTIPGNYKHELSTKEIDEIKQFVLNNREAIEVLADMDIEIDDFKKIMITGGKQATQEQKTKLLKDLEKAREDFQIRNHG